MYTLIDESGRVRWRGDSLAHGKIKFDKLQRWDHPRGELISGEWPMVMSVEKFNKQKLGSRIRRLPQWKRKLIACRVRTSDNLRS